MSADRAAPLIACLLGAWGCGPLADAEYRGEVLFTLTGQVTTSEPALSAEELNVGLFWAHDAVARQEQSVVLETAFPALYTLELYAYPPQEAMFTPPWDDGHEYAIGVPLLYIDADGDGEHSGGDDEPVVGGAPDIVVVFASALEGVHEEVDPVGELVQPGFQRMVAELGASLCASPTDQLEGLFPAEDIPTDIVVGDWWLDLEDWDCDEGFGEWEELCPEGDQLDEWCAEQGPAESDEPCYDLCFAP